MAADDKESDERRRSRSLERDRGKRRKRHRSASPYLAEQRRKRSRSPGAVEKHKHKNSAEEHEARRGHEVYSGMQKVCRRKTMAGKWPGKMVWKLMRRQVLEKAAKRIEKSNCVQVATPARTQMQTVRVTEGRGRSQEAKITKVEKSKSKHHPHLLSASEVYESQTEGTSGESSEGSGDESRRTKSRKRLKPKEKAERERMEERRPKKEKKRKMKEKEREQEKRMKKKEKVNLETLPNREDKDMLQQCREVKRKGIGDQAVSREDSQYHSRWGITEVCNEEKDHEWGDCLEGDNMHSSEASKDDHVLDPKHKIFLSHSGVQKEFVDYLCKALEDCWHSPFFDRRDESLPKGESFPELIVQAAEHCEMFIVVVSDEYFMSKWPMIELNAFVRAYKLRLKSKSSTKRPQILPLFYGLSVHDFKDASKRKKWIRKWKTLAKNDPKQRIKVSDWKDALDVLGEFKGIPYDANSKEVVAYINKIVSHVRKSIALDIKWDDSHVQGKSRICKVICEKIKGVDVSQKYNVKVVGIYGIGGIGKTTICKTLCNKLLIKYEGRVCHIEFRIAPQFKREELFQKVLIDLTKKSMEVIHQWNEGECENALHMSLSRHKVFLAIDNVSFNQKSIEHAKMFLKARYHKESLVIVTARSKSILEDLGIDGDACVEMPELEEVDAIKLFLHSAAQGKEFIGDQDKACILKCIQSCYFYKGLGFGYHYHPLALSVLGSHSDFFGKNPLEWVMNLPRVRTFRSIPGGNPVFGFLKSLFDSLPFREQRLFMDVGFCQLRNQYGCWGDSCDLEFFGTSIIQWLYNLHEEKEDDIGQQLENLKRRNLLQEVDVDLESGEIHLHDLTLEFVELEAKGSFNKMEDFKTQKWLYVDNGDLTKLERTPTGGCWTDLVHLNIVQPSLSSKKQCQIAVQIARLKRIQWDHFSNVEVLHLEGLHWGGGTLNLEHLMGLRALHLSNNVELGSLEGLEKLGNLTRFTWKSDDEGLGTRFVGSLPLSLKILVMSGGNVVFGTDFLAKCQNLSELWLGCLEANTLDLRGCRFLKTVNLIEISKLQTLSGLLDSQPSSLQSISVRDCKDLVYIPGMDHLIGLEELVIQDCIQFKFHGLFAPMEVLDLELRLGRGSFESPVVGAQNSFPHQLRRLHWNFSQVTNGLNLDGFNQLEVLDLGGNTELVSLEGLGDLPKLRDLNLAGCEHLSQLPNLRKSMNLKQLTLNGCYALELHKKDIQMLSELPSLDPVRFSAKMGFCVLRLDFRQRMALIPLCKGMQGDSYCGLFWEEHKFQKRDLGEPPLQIAKYGLV